MDFQYLTQEDWEVFRKDFPFAEAWLIERSNTREREHLERRKRILKEPLSTYFQQRLDELNTIVEWERLHLDAIEKSQKEKGEKS